MSPTYDYMNKQASFHSRQGRIWRLGLKFLLVRFRIGMSRENNSSSVRIAQLSLVNSAVRFAWFHKFSEPLPKASMRAHSRCRSTALKPWHCLEKILRFRVDSTQYSSTTYIFIAKAASTLNDVSSVSPVNLLMNKALQWYRAFKNHTGQSRFSLHMPRNKVPRLMGSPRQHAPANLSRNES